MSCFPFFRNLAKDIDDMHASATAFFHASRKMHTATNTHLGEMQKQIRRLEAGSTLHHEELVEIKTFLRDWRIGVHSKDAGLVFVE